MPKQQSLKAWNVRVHRSGGSLYLGQVNETTEALARCAALSRYGIRAASPSRRVPTKC